MSIAETYRRIAAEAYRLAEEAQSESVREGFIKTAQSWEQFAREAEQREAEEKKSAA
jgi:hypothetical protein